MEKFFLPLLIGTLLCFWQRVAKAQTDVNYDESKVGSYELPPLLRLPNGQTVTNRTTWQNTQRPYLLKLYQQHVFGKYPGKPNGMHFKVKETDNMALGGKAIRKQVTIYFTAADTGASMDVLLYLPKNANGPVPVFAGLNFKGNHTTNPDPGIFMTTRWVANSADVGITNHKATEASRGMQASRWPAEEMLAQGYGLATAYYGDLEPDYTEGWQTGIRNQLKEALATEPQEWGAMGAWAWGMSRMMDYLQTDPAINAQQVTLVGHSRIGKAALWAGANDTRFAIVVGNDSGEGGAALARRRFGETITNLNTSFPHWFCPQFKEYNNKPEQLPVDGHMLLALMAPRPLYIASAQEDLWADPKGEFLGAKNAEPAYQLFEKKGLVVGNLPAVNTPVGETIGYHLRTGKHDINLYDWQQYLTFANKHFGRNQRKQVSKK